MAKLGMWSLLLPVYTMALAAALFRPHATAIGLLGTAIVLEGGALDYTSPLSLALYKMPPGFENALGVTTSPLEILIIVLAARLSYGAAQTNERLRGLPAVAWAIPAVMALGMLYGLMKGAPHNLVYTEMRGLIAAIAIFCIAIRILPTQVNAVVRTVIASTTLLATVIIVRYLVYVRPGNTDVPPEFQFSHENSIILGIGLVAGAALMVDAKQLKRVVLLGLYCLLIFAALMVTGRRAATLVVLVGGLSMGCLLFPKRPVLVIAVAIPILLMGGVYLATYWNEEYGTMAQPARAIRSQFDPSLRDESSDSYRDIEKSDVLGTIQVNRIFGVGFGRPFIQFEGLPYLGSFWPLQSYTPHQSLLWLWLKMGWLGITVFLAFALVILKRCVEQMRIPNIAHRDWLLYAVFFTSTLMFLMYATVDLALAGARQVAPVTIVAGLVIGQSRVVRRAEP